MKAPVCRPEPLRRLFTEAGLAPVEVCAIDITTEFESFDDYWTPFLGGTGSAPKYCQSLDEPARGGAADGPRRRLPTGPDGEIWLAARAWAARGLVGRIGLERAATPITARCSRQGCFRGCYSLCYRVVLQPVFQGGRYFPGHFITVPEKIDHISSFVLMARPA